MSYLVHAIDPILGPGNQKLGRIGANGIMVIRLRVACWPDAGSCRLQLRMREGRQKGSNPYLGRLIYSLRRSRGATGRYQGPTGAAAVAARVPRRPMDGSDAFPG